MKIFIKYLFYILKAKNFYFIFNKKMSNSDFDEKGEPIPKDSVEIKDDNIPKESIKNLIQHKEEENQDNIKNNDDNEEIKNNQEENNDNNFPNPSNDDFDNYINDNENTQKKEDLNDDFNKDNTFNEDNLNNNENNDNTFRISEVNNRISDININKENNNRISDINNNNLNNNRISDINNNENNDNLFRDSTLNNENNDNNNYRDSINNENQNKENENENGFDYEGDNNFNENNLDENNFNNDHNNNGENSNFGFRNSNSKEDNNNLENENNNNLRNSSNSDNKELNNNNEEAQKADNNNLRNRPNNIINQNKNNFNYANNPYNSTTNQNYNNYNQNGGIANTDMNRTGAQFIPQDNNYVNNLNTFGGNYNNAQYSSKHHHPSYDPLYEQYEELPEDSDGYHLDKDKEGKDSTFSAGVQIANTIMGAGILSIPTIMNYLGILCGSIFIIFIAVSTLFSVNLLIKCHEITGKSGYSMFAKITMGTVGSVLIKVVIIINNLGICICYFRIFGEVLQTIVQSWVSSEKSFWVTNWHNFFYILIGSLIMLPFIFVKKISSLKKVAYLGVIFVLIFTITISVLLFYKSASNKLDQNITWDYLLPDTTFKDAFHIMPTVFIAFLFQFNVFPIYYSMKKRNMKTIMKATRIGVGYSLIMFLIVGIIGFLLYGDAIKDTILDNLSEDMLQRNNNVLIVVLIIIICFSFVITCLTSFPVLFFSLRVNYINSLIVCMKCCKKNEVTQVEVIQGQYGEEKKNDISRKAYIFITVCLYIFIIIFAILVYYLKTMFLIIGASAGTFIAFILPNFYYIIIVAKSGKNYNLILSYIYIGLGLFFFFISILLAFF